MVRLPGRKHLLVTLLLPFLASLFIAAATVPLPPRSDDISIAGSIEAYILGRSEILRLRVGSINIKKLGGEIDEGVYRSTWKVTLRFRANYAHPEEDPYLAGMLKCLNELKAASDDAWVQWAEDEIDNRRSEVWDLISYAQELEETVTAYAETDASGRVARDTIKLQVEGVNGAHAAHDLLRAVPRPELYEAAGYKYLRDARGVEPVEGKPDPEASGGPETPVILPKETPKAKDEPGPPQPAVPVQRVTSAIKPTTRTPLPKTGDGDSDRAYLIYWAMGLVVFLLLVLIASEIHNQKRKQSARRR